MSFLGFQVFLRFQNPKTQKPKTLSVRQVFATRVFKKQKHDKNLKTCI